MHGQSQTDDEIARLSSQSANAAQRILTRAGTLVVVPLRYAFDMQNADHYFINVGQDWITETLISEEGSERVLNRVPSTQGTPVRVVQWEEQSAWVQSLAVIAKQRKGYAIQSTAGLRPVEVLTSAFMNNGHLLVLHRLPHRNKADWGMVFAPPGEYGGGAHVLKADWAVTYPMPQPHDRAAAIAAANIDAPPEVVVEIKHAARGTPSGFYTKEYRR